MERSNRNNHHLKNTLTVLSGVLASIFSVYHEALAFSTTAGIVAGVPVVDAWGAGKWVLILLGCALLYTSAYLGRWGVRELVLVRYEHLNISRKNATLVTWKN